MNDQLKNEVKLKVLQFVKGQTLERNKLEFKRQWYNLSWTKKPGEGKELRNKEYYEFLKDCCAIINSYGRDDGFIVIGVDESKELFDTNLTDSGLNDSSKIKDVIIGNVDKAFLIDIDYINVEGKQLSVIHIPPSTDKPHLVAEYWSKNLHKSENVIWIKNGSGATIATRGDIDRMYWERSNIVLDDKLDVAMNLRNTRFNSISGSKIEVKSVPYIENVGTKKLLISKFRLNVSFQGERYTFYTEDTNRMLLPNHPTTELTLFYAFINLGDAERKKLADLMNQALQVLKFESFIAIKGNGEEILCVPQITTL